ncbi:MAG: YceK/YidQ family lipoprotein [Methylococcales bacterium]|nr:YceK/YidQ family lipoprotein [Methylococcales bacterium]
MKSDIGIWAVVVLMSFLMFGCSSIRARTETPDKKWTVYPGIQLDVKETGKLFSGKSPDPGWIDGVVAAILIADLPFSAVFDTVVAPYDLYRIYTPKNSGEDSESLR